MRKEAIVVDEKLNNEILYWISRKGWDERKIVLTSFEWSEDKEHECCSNGECERCSQNPKRHFRSVEFSPLHSKEKIVIVSHCDDTIGSIWSDYYVTP